MKKAFLFITVMLISFCVSGQDTLPKGVYMSLEEIRSATPSQVVNLSVTKRTTFDIKMSGGNDYTLKSEDDAVSKKMIKKGILAYSSGEQLFINGFKYGICLHYCQAETVGRCIAMRGSLFSDQAKQREQLDSPNLGYMFGGIGGAIQGAQLATIRLLYVIDTETGEFSQVSDELMRVLLSNHEELLESYLEENQKDENVFLKYLKFINEVEATEK